ncbi:hypothetical protein MSIMFI_01208 [Mycobacterium simulans]|uniref:hypothetical protein n=1 Tax=Mycobacterium simulans TaxID=627089 RepID=UPI00174B0E3D|nr:hypothetical protein [Mycobacterium simulans]SON59724.1 hypothetical protein MSIMFI_01208 [Mycobacterium simulans]
MGRVIANHYAEIANTRRFGGQSEVFKAADLHQGGRPVAVKIVPAKSDDIYRLYFERETAALRKLSHPNIASLIDSGRDTDSGVPEVLQLLRDALSIAPDQRPAGGQVFHLALQTIQTKRSARWHKKKEIAFELTGAARQGLEEGGDGRSAEA